ncbi:hypothetical protein [Streptococcus sciuri]|uniref:DUF1372 family protein n=1 Tax=Streptococcus sciuri TaxID=2973939 RepID=A0ABT2F4U7_9STRE|nr:hypothetical protein [Streptococcus sciuri]MCS4487501.1 hypothetical protein [Streptococcus sciuri]
MKKLLILIALIASVLTILLYKGHQSREIRIGLTNGNFPTLVEGTYKQGVSLDLESGRYAVYAKTGKGTFRIGDNQYNLDSSLYEEAKKQPANTQNAVIYEESPKIFIPDGGEIFIEGDQGFSVSFIRR